MAGKRERGEEGGKKGRREGGLRERERGLIILFILKLCYDHYTLISVTCTLIDQYK